MRMHVVLDEDVVKGIDSKVGRRGRSKFIREAIEAKIEEDENRLAALERLRGSMPDLAPFLTRRRSKRRAVAKARPSTANSRTTGAGL